MIERGGQRNRELLEREGQRLDRKIREVESELERETIINGEGEGREEGAWAASGGMGRAWGDIQSLPIWKC